jgi:hypothetical protein
MEESLAKEKPLWLSPSDPDKHELCLLGSPYQAFGTVLCSTTHSTAFTEFHGVNSKFQTIEVMSLTAGLEKEGV